MEIEAQVQELQDQELPLREEQEQVLAEALALGQEQAQALLVQAQGRVLALEARVQALAGLLEQVQVEVEDLVEALQQEALVEEEPEVVVQVLQLAQAAPQEGGLEQALAQELAETEDLRVVPLLSLYQQK